MRIQAILQSSININSIIRVEIEDRSSKQKQKKVGS